MHQHNGIDMSKKIFFEQLEYAEQNKAGVLFTGGGEPTLHHDFPLLLTIILEHIVTSKLLGFGLITNGVGTVALAAIDKVCLELKKNPRSNIWVRVSLNDREPNDDLLKLIEQHPSLIGISIIASKNSNFQQIDHNINTFSSIKYHYIGSSHLLLSNKTTSKKYLVKGLRIIEDVCNDFTNFDPNTCVARKLSRVVETSGNIAYCCHARGKNGAAPSKCPTACRWLTVNKEINTALSDYNPFT